ncbi:MAG: hypothetical protein ACRECP_07970 [Methylocella sp.]
MMTTQGRTIFSFVMDHDPRFTYEAWHLARSLIEQCGGDPSSIHVQCLPEVTARRRRIFGEFGCHVHEIARFGDGRYCNKLNQLESFRELDFDRVVLLDTDMIATSDLRPFLGGAAIQAKIVDFANPPLATLEAIAAAAGLSKLPPVRGVDAGGDLTFEANCSGGFYSIPKELCAELSEGWRQWALWLLANMDPLLRVGRENHVDQISFWLAVQQGGLPFKAAPSNVNYFIHFDGAHAYFDDSQPIALLHYHSSSLTVLGLLEPQAHLDAAAQAAVAKANALIGNGFDNRVFWDLRYRHFRERGSGIGSRGDNLLLKRQLLREQGVEAASTVLDVGCGDLEVIKDLAIVNYLGIDQSSETLEIAQLARPDWSFRLAPAADAPAAEMVICFEVLIHQETDEAYRVLIDFLAQKTIGSLLVSGFAANHDSIRNSPMVFFYEPLPASLRRTGRFRAIRQIGAHTNVAVYRCDV